MAVPKQKGAFYNSLNQVVVHAGLYYMLLDKSTDESLYAPNVSERRHWIRPDMLSVVDRALGRAQGHPACNSDGASLIDMMPSPPDFQGDEESFFQYLGAQIEETGPAASPIKELSFEGGTVSLLEEITHYDIQSETEITGSPEYLCRLFQGQRVILSHDSTWSHIIVAKEPLPGEKVRVVTRRARPITDVGPILRLLEG